MASITLEDSLIWIEGQSNEEIYTGPQPNDGPCLYRRGKMHRLGGDDTNGYTLDGQSVTFADPDIAFDIQNNSVQVIYFASDTDGANDSDPSMPVVGRSLATIQADLSLATDTEIRAILADLIEVSAAALSVDYRNKIALIP